MPIEANTAMVHAQDEKDITVLITKEIEQELPCLKQDGRAHVRINQAELVRVKEAEMVERHQTDKRRFYVMFVLTALMFLIELGFGMWATSLALLADSLHMLSDFVALMIGYYSVRVLRKPRTLMRTYGLTRMEVVGALFNGAFMLSSTLFITLEAIDRFVLTLVGAQDTSDLEERSELVLIVGSAGLLFNIIGIVVFGHQHHGGHAHSHGHGHSHSHSHSHHHHEEEHECEEEHEHEHHHAEEEHDEDEHLIEEKKPKRKEIENLNIYGVLIHVIGDALGSVAVVATALVIKYTTWEYRSIVDPICSLVISAILCIGTVPLIKQSVGILLQNSPTSCSADEIMKELAEIPGVSSIHEFHVWQLSSKVVVASVHAVITNGHETMDVLDVIKSKLHSFGIHSSTVQPEVYCGQASALQHCKSGMGCDMCHDPVCGDDCLEKICCPIVAPEKDQTIQSN
jgi:zinc transporter 1